MAKGKYCEAVGSLPPLPSAHTSDSIHREGHRFPERQEYDRQNQRRRTMGDKGGKKDKEKGQKQKSMKHEKDLKDKKDKQPKRVLK
jgi:hypothetical protein